MRIGVVVVTLDGRRYAVGGFRIANNKLRVRAWAGGRGDGFSSCYTSRKCKPVSGGAAVRAHCLCEVVAEKTLSE